MLYIISQHRKPGFRFCYACLSFYSVLFTLFWFIFISILYQEWSDPLLVWDPDDYGNVSEIYVPQESIWGPEVVLYNK